MLSPKRNGPTVIVNDLSDAGIILISPEDPKFDFEVSQIVPAQVARVALALKPFVVIVANGSQRTIAAYSIVWRMTEKNGRKSTITLPFKYPDTLAGGADSSAVSLSNQENGPVPSEGKRLVSTEIQIDSSWEDQFYLDQLRSFARDLKQEYAEVDQIEITLDAAIFSDGSLLGSNQSNLDQEFMTYFESKQNLFRQIASDLDSGKSVDEAFDPLTILAANHVSARDMPGYYKMLAAQEINALRRRLSDTQVRDTVRSAIRKEAFVIRRNTQPIG